MKGFPESLRIGTCSWKYNSWVGLIYPANVGENYLTEYAKHFNIVEVDQWFWSSFGEKIVLPKPETISEYASSVPKEFRFSVKVPNAITLTHQYSKGKKGALEVNPYFLSNDLFEKFLKILEPMESQIDSLIFQFEYLNKEKMPNQNSFQDQLEKFFERTPPAGRHCIEIRNKNFLNKSYFSFLQAKKLHHVFLQGYWMPSIFMIYEQFKEYIEKHTVIRLHGPDRKGIEQKTQNRWDAIVDPRDDELHSLNNMVNSLLAKEVQVTLSVNNHYEGCAPITVKKFLKIFSGEPFI